MSTTNAQDKLIEEIDKAATSDLRIASLITQCGYPKPRARPNSFATLMQIVVSQQLSTKAAAAIWARVRQIFNGDVNYQKVLSTQDQVLRDCGLSWRKVEYSKVLALQIAKEEIDLSELSKQSTEDVVAALIKIKGFGRWSAEIYAMFALDHPDVFPAADLALQVAAGKICCLEDRPSEKQTREIAQQWSPHRSGMALFLWHYYGSTTLD